MIKFNLQDYKMKSIREKTGMDTTETDKEYLVYGIRNEGNFPIKVSIPSSDTDGPTSSSVNHVDVSKLAAMFAGSGIDIQVLTRNLANYPETIGVGLRRDLRDDIDFTAKAIKSIVFFLEGRLTIKDGFKLPNPPKIEAFKPLPKYISANHQGVPIVWDESSKTWLLCDSTGNPL